jgi:epoxide hydrolase
VSRFRIDMVGALTDPTAHGGEATDAFHVVAPSLPGFGFSSPLAATGWESTRTARPG